MDIVLVLIAAVNFDPVITFGDLAQILVVVWLSAPDYCSRGLRKVINSIRTMTVHDILGRVGLNIDDLNSAERATLMRQVEALRTKQIQVLDVRAFVDGSIAAIERELAGLDKPETFFQYWFGRKRDTYLKARLTNMLMLREFLTGPERAQAFIERQLHEIKVQ